MSLQRALQQIGKKCMVKSKLEILGKKKVKIIRTGYRRRQESCVVYTFYFCFCFFRRWPNGWTESHADIATFSYAREFVCMHGYTYVCVCIWQRGSKKCQCRWHTWLCASAMGVDYRVRSTKLNWTELSWAKLLCSALLRFALLCLRAPRLSNAVFRTQFKAIKALRA